MSKAFETINIHTLIRKLLQTMIPGIIIKLIANYIKGHKSYTTYINHSSSQRQFKTGVPHGGVLHQHYSAFTLQTYHHLEHRFRSWSMTFPLHLHTQARVQPRNTYSHTYIKFCLDRNNNLILNPDKTTCTLFPPDPAEYKSNMDLKINKTTLPMATHPKVLVPTLEPKLTHSTHICNISVQAHKSLQMIKSTHSNWMG